MPKLASSNKISYSSLCDGKNIAVNLILVVMLRIKVTEQLLRILDIYVETTKIPDIV